MKPQSFVPRILRFVADDREQQLRHDELLGLAANMVILGGAGIGKTKLLEELDCEKAKFVTAQRLINHPQPRELVAGFDFLLVDALDEAAAYKAGEAVNRVLHQIERAGAPHFVLSCRAEDWQTATAGSLIAETFGHHPLEMTLMPFDDEQIEKFLEELVGAEAAAETIATYNERGFSSWLGNPQTLSMLADLIGEGQHPDSTTALFEGFVDLSLPETNRSRRSQNGDVGLEARKDILGGAFAALILSGKTALARPGAVPSDDDLPLSDLVALPGGIELDAVSGNRLIRSYRGDSDRLTYSHRRLGEWLAARWLAKQARSEEVRDRLFAALITDGVVPASLRGLFGWLAGYAEFAEKVIDTDPMAVIEYADADILSEESAGTLLASLERVAKVDPYFIGWSRSRAKALVRGNQLDATLELMRDTSRNARLRILLAQQFKGEALSDQSAKTLRSLALNPKEFYAIRSVAAEAIVENLEPAEVSHFVEILRGQGSHDSTRLASHLLVYAGFDHFSDEQIVRTVMADCGHTICAVPNEGEDRMAAKTWPMRAKIPDGRVDGVLEILAVYAESLLPEHRSIESSDIINLGDALISRRIALGDVEPSRLLSWLKAFGGRDSYDKDDKEAISGFLRENDAIRQAVQKLWLTSAETQKDFFWAAHRLHDLNHALALDDCDLAAFLGSLPADFQYWQEATRLIRHDADSGEQSRLAARRFANSDAEYEDFIDALLNPEKPEWQVEQEQRAAERDADRIERWSKFRDGMMEDEELIRQGRYGLILQAANVYFSRYADIHDLDLDARMDALCGRELLPAIRKGFDAFLNRLPPYPYAKEIAQSYAESKAWDARYVLLAGLAERFRTTGTIEPIVRDQLVAAQLHVAHHALGHDDEWGDLQNAIWNSLTSDDEAFESYARLLVEPLLKNGDEIIMGLHELLRAGKAANAALVEALAVDWLHRFPESHHRPEAELVDFLFSEGEHDSLKAIAEERLRMAEMTDEKRRSWLAVNLLCNFEEAAAAITAEELAEPELFWTVRERAGARRPYDDTSDRFTSELAFWLVKHFRKVFPMVVRPDRVTSGDTNPWDATEAISRLIDRIGTDPSEDAEQLLEELASRDDGYQERLLAVLAEHRRSGAERKRATLSAAELAAILTHGPPQTLVDLQVRMLQLLDRVEAQARSSPTDSWVNFFRDDGMTPHGEERLRDRIIEMLQQHDHQIKFSPEKHLGEDREGDIACENDDLHLPIEVKGQWHRDLWRAADNQLAAQQACDYQAQGFGIFLVLWFGTKGKPLVGPPRRSGVTKPKTPEDLELALAQTSEAARQGKIAIKVLDLSRG